MDLRIDENQVAFSIVSELKSINEKLDRIIDVLERLSGSYTLMERRNLKFGRVLDVLTLLSLPDNLRKTAMAMCKLNEATADQIAEETGRKRAVESSLLNQLARMGYLRKKRVGRKVYFYLK